MKIDPFSIVSPWFEVLPEYQMRGVPLPRRATEFSAGYDLTSVDDVVIEPGERILINTGLTAYIPARGELQIRSRSGLALKYGIIVLNSPGTIDADYQGKHIKVLLHNASDASYHVEIGDKIAQGVFAPYMITNDDNPVDQERAGGFGHTGK